MVRAKGETTATYARRTIQVNAPADPEPLAAHDMFEEEDNSDPDDFVPKMLKVCALNWLYRTEL